MSRLLALSALIAGMSMGALAEPPFAGMRTNDQLDRSRAGQPKRRSATTAKSRAKMAAASRRQQRKRK